MGIKRVRFNNFRNIAPRELSWSPGLNLLTGENGAGKTNILEGLNILSGWGAFEHGGSISSVPTWESGSSEVQLTGELHSGSVVKVKLARRCFIRLDEKTITAADMRRENPVLSFLPADMAIIEGSASCRRRLIDMLLALIIAAYGPRLSEYRRAVRQKAALLKKGLSSMPADRVLLPLSSWIWKMRAEGVRLLSEALLQFTERAPAPLEMRLKRGGAGLASDFSEDYIASVTAQKAAEGSLRFPLVGPHRDDIVITAGKRTASEALSRGLRRRAAIAVMLAASEGVRRKTGTEPVLLLDEVTAELDAEGRRLLFETLFNRKTQVFAASAEPFLEAFPGTVYKIFHGQLVD